MLHLEEQPIKETFAPVEKLHLTSITLNDYTGTSDFGIRFFKVLGESNISDNISDCSCCLKEILYHFSWTCPLFLAVDGISSVSQACDLDVIFNFSKIYLRAIVAYLTVKQFAR